MNSHVIIQLPCISQSAFLTWQFLKKCQQAMLEKCVVLTAAIACETIGTYNLCETQLDRHQARYTGSPKE